MEQPSVEVLVSFLSQKDGGRVSQPRLNKPVDKPGYMPHFRLMNDQEMLGVEFTESPEEVKPDTPIHAKVRLMYYPGVTYEKLIVGAEFEILEGPRRVGTGKVTKRS